MSSNQKCIYCLKECKSSDSKPFPSSKSKDRIHNRCHIKKSLADKQPKISSTRGDTDDQQESQTPGESKITSSLGSSSQLNLVDRLREDNEKLKIEANSQKLIKMMNEQEEQAKKARKDASFFFDIKAGIAKPHEKRQYLHHRNICEIAPRYNDHGYQEEALGRSYDHNGKDLNTLGDDSDDEAEDEAKQSEPVRRDVSGDNKADSRLATVGKRKSDNDNFQEVGARKAKRTNVGLKVDEKNPCWFCLSSPKVEKHLIVAIGDYCYLTLAKGGLIDQHLLLIPIEHIQSLNDPANSVDLMQELDKFKKSLVEYFKSQSMAVVFFERNFRSVHWQIQIVPVAEDLLSDLDERIKSISKTHFANSSYIDIPSNCSLGDMVPPGAPYLYWQIEPSSKRFVCQIEIANSFFPIQLPRMVLADKTIMNCQERVDWKRCSKSLEDYVELVKEIKQQYQEYDIT